MAAFLITFRETLEAALITGIVLAFLTRTGHGQYRRHVYTGVLLGILLSLVFAFFFQSLFGSFSGEAEEIFEGIFSIAGAVLITTLILWMLRQRSVALSIEKKVSADIEKARPVGIFFLILVSILREGVEMVIFLESASTIVGVGIWSSVLGILAALFLGYLIFFTSMRISLKAVFNVTNALLILFAAGLVAYGVHELQEAGLLPVFIEHLWYINSIVDENGAFGGILKGLFGYNGNPSLMEVMAYLVYLISVIFVSVKGLRVRIREVTVR